MDFLRKMGNLAKELDPGMGLKGVASSGEGEVGEISGFRSP